MSAVCAVATASVLVRTARCVWRRNSFSIPRYASVAEYVLMPVPVPRANLQAAG